MSGPSQAQKRKFRDLAVAELLASGEMRGRGFVSIGQEVGLTYEDSIAQLRALRRAKVVKMTYSERNELYYSSFQLTANAKQKAMSDGSMVKKSKQIARTRDVQIKRLRKPARRGLIARLFGL